MITSEPAVGMTRSQAAATSRRQNIVTETAILVLVS